MYRKIYEFILVYRIVQIKRHHCRIDENSNAIRHRQRSSTKVTNSNQLNPVWD